MTPTLRKPFGIIGMLVYLAVYAGVVSRLLGPLGQLSWYAAVPVYLILGTLWLAPMKPLLLWMETGSWRRPR